MDSDTVHVAIGLQLAAPLCLPHVCLYWWADVDNLGNHGLSCCKNQGRHARHASINILVRLKCGMPHVPTPWPPCHIALASREPGLVAEQAEQKRSRSTPTCWSLTTQSQGDIFIIPNRAHPIFTKGAGDLIFFSISSPWGKK